MAEFNDTWPTDQRTFNVPLAVGVISDTHVHARGSRRVAPEIYDLFERFGVGLILHAGDVNVRGVLDRLAEIAPVLAVVGNNDDYELQAMLPMEAWFDVGPHRFVLLHGHGGKSALSRAREFVGQARCVVFGHSHEPLIEEEDGTILFNPGSATDRRWHEHFGIGILHVTAEAIVPELILFDSPSHLVHIEPD